MTVVILDTLVVVHSFVDSNINDEDCSKARLQAHVANPRLVATIKTCHVRMHLWLVERRDRSWLWRLVLDLQHAPGLGTQPNCTFYQTVAKLCAHVKWQIVDAGLSSGWDQVVMFARKVSHGRHIGILLVVVVGHLLMTYERRQVAPETKRNASVLRNWRTDSHHLCTNDHKYRLAAPCGSRAVSKWVSV